MKKAAPFSVIRTHSTALFVFSFALFWRLLYIFIARANDPLFFHPQMDPLYHHQMAVSLLKGGFLAEGCFFRAPLYPYLLALVYKIFGINLFLPRIIQSIVGAGSCLLIYLIGKRLFSRKVGLFSSLVAGLYPLLLYFDAELLLPNLLIFLILLGFYLLITERIFLSGLTFGLAAITRPNVLAFVISLPLYFYIRRDRWLSRAAILLCGVTLPILPVAVRNYIKGRDFVLIAWQGGINFYIGNNPKSDGITAIIPGTRGSWWGGFYDAVRIAEEEMAKKLKPSEIDRYWFRRSFEFITGSPIKALLLFLRKAYLFFNGFEISNNRDIYFFSGFNFIRYLLFNLPFFKFPFGILFPAALVGIYYSLRKSKWEIRRRRYLVPIYLFLITYSLSFIVFFVNARYRMPLIPFLILFAVYGFFELWSEARAKGAVFPAVLFVGSYLIVNSDIFNISNPNLGQTYTTVGIAEREAGNQNKAYEYALRAIAEDSLWAEAYNLLGALLKERGEFRAAKQILRKSLAINPYGPEALVNLGNVYVAKGEKDSAERYYLKAIELDPYAGKAFNNLGNIYFERGRLKEALLMYEKAIALEPLFDAALFHSGLVYYYLGEKDRANAIWRKVLEINPKNRMAKAALEELR